MFILIYIEHRNPETQKNTYDVLLQVRNFLLPLSLKVFRHKEKDTPDFSICPKPRAHPPQGHVELAKFNFLLPRQEPNSLTFLKSQPTLPMREVIHIPLSGISIVTSLQWGKTPTPSWVSWYDPKQSDGVVLIMLELWGMWDNPSLPLLSAPLWPGVLTLDWVLSMDQIELNCVLMLNWMLETELFWYLNCILMLTWNVWNRTVLTFKLVTYKKLDCLKWNCFCLHFITYSV